LRRKKYLEIPLTRFSAGKEGGEERNEKGGEEVKLRGLQLKERWWGVVVKRRNGERY